MFMHAACRKMERNKKEKKIAVLYWLKERYNINIYTHFFFFCFNRLKLFYYAEK